MQVSGGCCSSRLDQPTAEVGQQAYGDARWNSKRVATAYLAVLLECMLRCNVYAWLLCITNSKVVFLGALLCSVLRVWDVRIVLCSA